MLTNSCFLKHAFETQCQKLADLRAAQAPLFPAAHAYTAA